MANVRHRGQKGGGDGASSAEKPKGGPFSGRFNPRLHKRPDRSADATWMNHQTLSRIVMCVCVILIIYWSSTPSRVTIMAKQSEIINPKRYQQFLCAPSFRKEIEDSGNKGCAPHKCGRMVTDTLISADEANDLLMLAKKGLSKGGGDGGASILDLHSGALSKGRGFISVYDKFPDLFSAQDFEIYSKVKRKVQEALADHFQISPDSLYFTHPTFFSRLDNKPPQGVHDEYWHVHVDKTTYPEFHYTSLLYLTDHGTDFEGGEFVFVDSHDKLNRTVQPRMGRVSMFTSGIENKHHVERVTKGTRYALTIGFTCDPKKAVPDPGSEDHEEFQRSKAKKS